MPATMHLALTGMLLEYAACALVASHWNICTSAAQTNGIYLPIYHLHDDLALSLHWSDWSLGKYCTPDCLNAYRFTALFMFQIIKVVAVSRNCAVSVCLLTGWSLKFHRNLRLHLCLLDCNRFKTMAILSKNNWWKCSCEKCVRNASTDEPQEKLRNKRTGLGKRAFEHSSYCVIFFFFYISFIIITGLSSLCFSLSASLSSPCSTCLSELGRARYTHSTRGGPCLLSINNLWNSEIQVGPVCGRLYHTLEGGLPGTLNEASICHRTCLLSHRSD